MTQKQLRALMLAAAASPLVAIYAIGVVQEAKTQIRRSSAQRRMREAYGKKLNTLPTDDAIEIGLRFEEIIKDF